MEPSCIPLEGNNRDSRHKAENDPRREARADCRSLLPIHHSLLIESSTPQGGVNFRPMDSMTPLMWASASGVGPG
jgi:hypothetical protein